MRNRKNMLALMLLIVLVAMCCVTTRAEDVTKGSIKVLLMDGEEGTSKENVTFEYTKVATLIDGKYLLEEQYKKTAIDFNHIEYSSQMDEAARKLDKCVKEGERVRTDEEGKAYISELEVGVYLLRVVDKAKYEQIPPTLISIPTWDQEQENMNYHITVIPKHSSVGVATGDGHFYQGYLVLFSISFIFLVGLSCHTHLKCGKIAGNYSEKGGYTHGNDNDTKDSCGTRRVRPSGGRSIN